MNNINQAIPMIFENDQDALQLETDLDLFATFDMGYGSDLVDMKTELMYELVEPQEDGEDLLDLPIISEEDLLPITSEYVLDRTLLDRNAPAAEVYVSKQEEITAVVSDMEDLSEYSDDETRSYASHSNFAIELNCTSEPSFCVHEEFLKKQMQIAFNNLQQSMRRSDSSRRQLMAMTRARETPSMTSAQKPSEETSKSQNSQPTADECMSYTRTGKGKTSVSKTRPVKKSSAKKHNSIPKKKVQIKAQMVLSSSTTGSHPSMTKNSHYSANPSKVLSNTNSLNLAERPSPMPSSDIAGNNLLETAC